MKEKKKGQEIKQKFTWNNFFQGFKSNLPLIILGLADVVSFALPEYLENFIPKLYENLDLTASQYSQTAAVYGYVSLPGYLIGSYLGDKFKAKHLIIASLITTSIFGLWYLSLPLSATVLSSQTIYIQLNVIFVGLSISICTLLWGPLWKVVKNHNTDDLEGPLKEKRVGANNGFEGMMNGLMGLTLALIGTLFIQLSTADLLPPIWINGVAVKTGFFVSILIYVLLMISSIALIWVFVKSEADRVEKPSFSLKTIGQVLKNGQIWLLAVLVMGVYLLQMELSSYINYLRNIFLILPVVVMIIGIFRTYAMRFLVSGWFGKMADKGRSYILWLTIGLAIGIIFVAIGIFLPGFGNDFNTLDQNSPGFIALQVASAINFIILGGVTWALVTIRFSPLGAELNIKNEDYATALNVLSTIAFTPKAFFKQIKSVIEANNHDATPEQNATQWGNQLIMISVIAIALVGVAAGLTLYIMLYRHSDNYIFRRRKSHNALVRSSN